MPPRWWWTSLPTLPTIRSRYRLENHRGAPATRTKEMSKCYESTSLGRRMSLWS